MKVLDRAFVAARTFHPMDEAETVAILAKTQQAAARGKYEPYKTSTRFDGTIHNPQWMTSA